MTKIAVSRSIDVAAEPERVFDVVSDFSRWSQWSPWLCAEPSTQVTVSDDPRAVGATYAWKGELTGAGEMEHQVVESPRTVDMKLQFLKPWKSTARTKFELSPTGDGTRLTWRMDSSLPWFLFWMRSQMESFIGMDYDRGLKMLKDLVETGSIESQTEIHGVVTIGPLYVAGIRDRCTLANIDASMRQSIEVANERLSQADICTAGEMIAVYHDFNCKNQTFDYTIGYILDSAAEPQPGVSVWNLPASKALRVDHRGRSHHEGNAWAAAYMYARHHKLKPSKAGGFTIYKNNPNEVAATECLAEVYLLLK